MAILAGCGGYSVIPTQVAEQVNHRSPDVCIQFPAGLPCIQYRSRCARGALAEVLAATGTTPLAPHVALIRFHFDVIVTGNTLSMAELMQDPLSQTTLLARCIRSIGTPSFMPDLTDYMRSLSTFRGVFVVRLRETGAPEHIYDNVRAERRAIVIDRWLDGAWHLDPFVAAFQKGNSQPVMKLEDVAPDRFMQTPYFHTYYKSVRLRDELAVFVPLHDSTLFFSLGRLAGERRFSRRDAKQFESSCEVLSALCQQHFGRRASGMEPASPPLPFDALAEKVEGGLTERETEIVRLILSGHSSRSVALVLDVSPATVKVHRKNIYRKLGISSQTELFSIFLQIAGSTEG